MKKGVNLDNNQGNNLNIFFWLLPIERVWPKGEMRSLPPLRIVDVLGRHLREDLYGRVQV